MKKLLTPLFALAIMFSVTMVTAKQAPDIVEKGKIEIVAEAASHIALEQKEAYKIDDGEYEGFVITNAGFSGTSIVSSLGILAFLALIAQAFKRRAQITKAQINVGVRLLIASIILFLSKGVSPLTGMVMAGVVMGFPSLKSWAAQKRRLATGEGDEELEVIKELKDEVTQIKEAHAIKLGEIHEDLQRLKDNSGGRALVKNTLVKKEDLQNFVNTTFKDGQKTSDKATIKINSEMVFKAAENIGYGAFFDGATGTDQSAFTGRMVDPMFYQRKRKKNLILDHFPIEMTTVPKLIYLEKKEVAGAGDSGSNTATGGAEWIAPGGQKPQRSFRATTGEVEAKKLAIFGTVEDKLLRDVASLENFIREDFIQEMMETYNDGLLNNNPGVDPDAPLGLKQNAIQYSATAAFDESIVNPQYIDMIIAAAAKMADLKEQPGKAFIASDVWYRIYSLKDADGRFLNKDLVYNAATGQLYLAGIELVPSDSEDVPSTHLLLIAQDPGFKIKNYGPMVFERGMNGEDFRHDRTSYRGYQEVLSYIPEHRENTIMYDTWANIEAAISAPIES